MKCDETIQNLVSLLYGEIEKEEKKWVQNHLKSCRSCRKTYKELQSTTKLLSRWEDVTPNLKIVFVRDPSNRWTKFRETIRKLGWGRRLAIAIPAFAAILLLFFSVLNLQIGYQKGDWHVAFSLFPKTRESIPLQDIKRTLEQEKKETFLLVSQMIEESEYRQQRQVGLTLSRLAQDLERQRQRDLSIVNSSLEGFHRTTEGRFYRTNDVLTDLIRLTNYRMENK